MTQDTNAAPHAARRAAECAAAARSAEAREMVAAAVRWRSEAVRRSEAHLTV